jgi:hypothetical protein
MTIVIPPPNVTGALHIGHALNNTLQDILIRFERMRGKSGAVAAGHRSRRHRHADGGRAAACRRQGKDRRSWAARNSSKRVWAWKEESGGTIFNPAAPPRRLVRLERASASRWTKVFPPPCEGVRAAAQGRADLQRQAAGELGPAFPDGDLRSRSRDAAKCKGISGISNIRWPTA